MLGGFTDVEACLLHGSRSLDIVLVCLGCYNKTVDWVVYKQKIIFISVLEARTS